MSFEKPKNNFFQPQTPVNKSLALCSSPYIPENGGLEPNNISEGPLKTLEYPPGLKFNKLGILNKEQGVNNFPILDSTIESQKFLDFLLDDSNTDNSKPKFSQHQKSLKENILGIFKKTFSNAAELTSSFDNAFIDTNSSSLLLGNLGGNNLEKTRFSSTMNLALEDAIYKDNSKINKAFKSSKYTPEHIINAISEHKISCVPLLNEVGSKMKKQVDCILKETIVNKNKQ